MKRSRNLPFIRLIKASRPGLPVSDKQIPLANAFFPKNRFPPISGRSRRHPDLMELMMNKPEISPSIARDVAEFFARLGLPPERLTEGNNDICSPITGEVIARIKLADAAAVKDAIGRSVAAFRSWRLVPAPLRGELIRLLGNELRAEKEGLG